VDIFVEDRAHEEFIGRMLHRVAIEEQARVSARVVSARGGHGRAIEELKLYQRVVEKGAPGLGPPDLLIAGIDGNCTTFTKARNAIETATRPPLADRLVVACPDPHVERWYLADPESFKDVVGLRPTVAKRKCERDHYKEALAKVLRRAGHPQTLGGIEFAQELVDRMDLYRACKAERSLRIFVNDLRARLRTLSRSHSA
jgi:hypothetical protein